MATPETIPRLTPEIIGDAEAVAARIDELLRADARYRHHTRTILRAQDAMRRVLSDREWGVYLDLEALVNARLAYTMLRLVRWAFEQGHEQPACGPR